MNQANEQQLNPQIIKDDQEFYLNEKTFLKTLMYFKRHLTTAPTNIPRNFYEQIEFYDDGTNKRLYVYINGSWRYINLT